MTDREVLTGPDAHGSSHLTTEGKDTRRTTSSRNAISPASGLIGYPSAPSVAQVGNCTVIAVAQRDSSLMFYWQPIGSEQWNPEQVAGPGTTYVTPSVAQVGDFTVIAARGQEGSLLFYLQRIGSKQWSPGYEIAGSFTVFYPPSVAQVANSAAIAVTGPDGLLFYSQSPDSGAWSQEEVAAADVSFTQPSVAQVGNSVVIAAQGPSNSVRFWWKPIDSRQWAFEQVVFPS